MDSLKIALLLAVLAVGHSAKRHSLFRPLTQRVVCPANEFQCKDGLACVPLKWTCDTEADCNDRSDEALNCPTDCSHANQFRCDDGECVSRDFACDGGNDCQDGSDEQKCADFVCPDGEIKCDNNICIESVWKCDGEDDCGNGWDEKNCSS
ncbi:low-density lipoprotein receptor-related protein 8-like [Physella acuta]|uniref:low-density lipoprotein receptor-related protein 8-like n=1 Tax=Physella acuta TaxID=109671 RepID=UPI0027DACEB7|nr:low-density lipoprotein receptor-related protein 8-like [Physella acuta]